MHSHHDETPESSELARARSLVEQKQRRERKKKEKMKKEKMMEKLREKLKGKFN